MDSNDTSCITVKSAVTSRMTEVQSDFTAGRTIASQYHCVSEITERPNEILEEIEGLFEELCSLSLQSDSVTSEHVRGDNTKILNENKSVATDHLTDDIIENMLNNDTLRKVSALSTTDMKQCCKSIFESLAVESAGKLCRETLECNKAWKKAREMRISGSRIYGIYTYTKNSSPNWEQKSMNFFWPIQFTNKFVRHGNAHEQLARETYEIVRNVKVMQCGFVVHPDHRWIGYSPDGLIFENGRAEKLIEIKCVYKGKYKPIIECLSSCKFLDKGGGLKRKHTYYGQIQLGMLLCNVKICDFTVFSSFDKSVHVISVPFDEKFALDMFTVVQKAYLAEMLHYVCLHKNEENVSK